MSPQALALTVEVRGGDGVALADYRWLLQEDTTYPVEPGAPDTGSLAVGFHRSHARVVAEGRSDDGSLAALVLDPETRYYLTILPKAGYGMGGTEIKPRQTSASVVVNALPLPTAQISVFVFEDSSPINNQADLPAEGGLAGFSVILDDAGGRFGHVGGRVTQDAFGNPLGTTYDAAGKVLAMGSGELLSGADGRVVIKNLAPAKYGVKVIPPSADWVQTTTIEGTKTIDAWVKANEPATFTEFGPASEHVVVGFVRPTTDATALTGGVTVSGQVVNLHMSRPPEFTFHNGGPFAHTNCWVGLNSLAVGGGGRGLYAQKCGEDGTFSVPDVPPGAYQLVFWDDNLDLIFAGLGLTVNGDGTCATANGRCDLLEVPMFNWFGALRTKVFLDKNQNGFRDDGETGIPNVAVNLRYRDGTIYQSFTTDGNGDAPFDEVFPFFHWLVAEVDFARFKATGATIVVDAGGPVPADQGWAMPSLGVLNPQAQQEANSNTGNALSRTETGPVLTQGIQTFLGSTNVIEFGKSPYGPGENGGISGVVYYATTRAEDDPRHAAADPWEPGIPRVQVNLYRDSNGDGKIDAQGGGALVLADVDNFPFGWSGDPASKGPEDIDRNGNGSFELGDAISFTRTDSWDDNLPAGCRGDPFVLRGRATDCYDGLRNYNQVRPAVFDGGYAFADLAAGVYIVEAAVPPGYSLVKEEDRNVDFGDDYRPVPDLLPPVCVGEPRVVPATLSFLRGETEPAPFAGQSRPLCDRKQVTLGDGINAAADFHLFTQVPIAGQAVGFVLDDLANEFDPTSPQFGEKFGPSWIPVAVKDWTGREIARTYTDEWGKYNFLVPSTYTANLPMPTGMSPNMLILCMNDAGPIPDPANPGQMVLDPHFNRKYSQFCYTFQFMPGTTTYLDTPVVPVAAFAGPDQFSVDCELADGTPQVHSVSGWQGGPFATPANPRLTIVSRGPAVVANPAYDGPGGLLPKTITRDYGFGGTPGQVTVGGVPLVNVTWSDGVISGDIAAGTVSGQLEITRADGRRTVDAVHVTVGPIAGAVRHVQPAADPMATPIQDAIDLAAPGDLILVAPGRYEEMPIMWKPVQLQGWGAGSTIINAVRHPGEKMEAWRAKLASILASRQVTLLPGQDNLQAEEGAVILVLGRNLRESRGGFGPKHAPRIDGFTIAGSDNGGGIVVNGYAHALAVSNNKVIGNLGVFGGGVRVGHPELVTERNRGALRVVDAQNDGVHVHHNQISQNGGLGGAGGGIAVCTGADEYRISANFVCGNFTQGHGGGIGHLGLSDRGRIEHNTILFNQSFSQGTSVAGGGIFIGGVQTGTALTDGSGSVTVNANHLQGNQAGAGDGGGIAIAAANGRDVDRSRNSRRWHAIDIVNNMVVNNVAGLAGGGISLQDAVRVRILNNTVAHNDSTATAGLAFTPGNPDQSRPQPAGIVSRAHSPRLSAAMRTGAVAHSDPLLINNIIWENRSFSFVTGYDEAADLPVYGLKPDIAAGEAPVFHDLAVLGTAAPAALSPSHSVLTDPSSGDGTNRVADPGFVLPYFNGSRQSVTQVELKTSMAAQPAFDEGGNFVDVKFGPLTRLGDYHLAPGSGAVDAGDPGLPGDLADLAADIDSDPRPEGSLADLGADEWRNAQ
ncbi:MAG: SdrD B-like domain-containing protein [Pseudomonadota bacterium]